MFEFLSRWFGTSSRVEKDKDAKVATPILRPPWIKVWADTEMEERRWTPDLPELERKEFHWLFVPDELQSGHPHNFLLNGFVTREERWFTQGKFMALTHNPGPNAKLLAFDNDLRYQNPPELLPLRGELYKIPPAMFIPLDQYKSNGVFYFRRQIAVVTPVEAYAFKDRAVAEALFGHMSRPNLKTVAHFRKKHFETAQTVEGAVMEPISTAVSLARGNSINSSIVKRPAVHRIPDAWMYIAVPQHWEDIIDRTNNHPPVQRMSSEGLIRRYYRFTPLEYTRKLSDDDPNKPPF